MNLDEITTKPYILALFKRDDGERFLLGSGEYEFKEKQLHFVANNIVNDVVEMQGSDGALLAGQVRRAKVQSFDGFVGDGSTIKTKVEQYRTSFIKFFQKNHFYTVVYVFSDGTAIQRRRGYIVDAPEVKELYQYTPEYHIALNFEDVNYYKYAEDEEGEEMFSNIAEILSQIEKSGGLVWEASAGPTTEEKTVSGNPITINDAVATNLVKVDINGDTEQATYSGKNLLNVFAYLTVGNTVTSNGVDMTLNADGTLTINGTATGANAQLYITNGGASLAAANNKVVLEMISGTISGGESKIWFYSFDNNFVGTAVASLSGVGIASGACNVQTATQTRFRFTVNQGVSVNGVFRVMFENVNETNTYDKFVGGNASPNPNYPQEVQTVTGEQNVTISDGGSNSQSYKINLGKNLFDPANIVSGKGLNYPDGTEYNAANRSISNWIKVVPGVSYCVSGLTVKVAMFYAGTNVSTKVSGTNSMPADGVLTAPNGANYLRIAFDNTADYSQAQVEKGSSATTYAAYFAPIELCKIGTYQDYIYKSGSDWYIHREVGVAPITSSDASWYRQGSAHPNGFTATFANVWAGGTVNLTSSVLKMSDYYHYEEEAWTGGNGAFGITSTGVLWLTHTSDLSLADFKTWLDTRNPKIYAPLATATDTQITDATLISQLEDLAGADAYEGTTIISVSSTPTNIAGTLTVSYVANIPGFIGGVEWDNIGSVWQTGGGGGAENIVTVDSIINVLPTIRITGPAENPIITNITTGQAIQYYGNITSSQELVINIQQKTAKLNGTSVIQNVDGDWLELAPGNNRITYTIDNAEENSATMEWQEIVG